MPRETEPKPRVMRFLLTQGCACGYRFSLQCDLSSAIEDLVLYSFVIPCTCRLNKSQNKMPVIARREGQKEFEGQSQSFQNFCLKSQAFAAAVSYREARDFGEYCLEDLATLQDECRDLTG